MAADTYTPMRATDNTVREVRDISHALGMQLCGIDVTLTVCEDRSGRTWIRVLDSNGPGLHFVQVMQYYRGMRED